MRELHSHDFLINPVSAGLRTDTEGQVGERGGGVLYLSIWLVVNCNDFDKIIFLMVDQDIL